jgi:hypothetical protein
MWRQCSNLLSAENVNLISEVSQFLYALVDLVATQRDRQGDLGDAGQAQR